MQNILRTKYDNIEDQFMHLRSFVVWDYLEMIVTGYNKQVFFVINDVIDIFVEESTEQEVYLGVRVEATKVGLWLEYAKMIRENPLAGWHESSRGLRYGDAFKPNIKPLKVRNVE